MINSSIENIFPTVGQLAQIVPIIGRLWDFSFQSFTFFSFRYQILSRTSRNLIDFDEDEIEIEILEVEPENLDC